MGLIFNGNSPEHIIYNGNNVSEVYYNGVKVWPLGVIVELTGISPLILLNALEANLVSLTLYGKCEQSGSGTPSPTNVMPIICNNGQIKVRNKSGLPLGYQAIEYVESSGTQYIDTGISGECKVIIDCQGNDTASASEIVVGSYTSAPSFFGAYGATNKWGMSGSSYGLLTDVDYTTRATFEIYFRDDAYIKVNGTTYTCAGTVPIYTSATYALFRAKGKASSVYYYASAKIYSCKFEQNNTLVRNLIPARRNSDNVIGMYDTVTDTFLTNEGTGSFVAGPNIANDMEIYADGTVETVELDTSGDTATAEMLLGVSTYKDEQEVNSGAITRKVGVLVLKGTENWTVSTNYPNVYQYNVTVTSVSTPICTHFVGLNVSRTIGNVSATTNAIKFEPSSSFSKRLFVNISSIGTTKADLVNYLAQQYANGTPVIVVYPLSVSTTETVTGQTLSTTNGTNTLEITQASLTGLEMAVEYYASEAPSAQNSLNATRVASRTLGPNATKTVLLDRSDEIVVKIPLDQVEVNELSRDEDEPADEVEDE